MKKQLVSVVGVIVLALSLSCTWLSLPEDEEGIASLESAHGLTLMIKEDNHKPLISLHALIRLNEKLPQTNDILKSEILASLLSKGTKNHPTPLEFQKHLENLNIFLEIETKGPTISIYLEAPSKQRENIVLTLVEILTDALIDPTEFAKVKKNIVFQYTLVPLEARRSFLVSSAAYSATSPLEAISHNDIVQLYREKFVASNTVLTLFGDFNAKRLARFVKKRMGGFQKGTKLPFSDIPALTAQDLSIVIFPPRGSSQLINFSFLGPQASAIEAPSFILATFIVESFFSQ